MRRCPYSTHMQRVSKRLVCRCEKNNVLAEEIAGFGGLNHYFQLNSMKYRLNVSYDLLGL